MDASRVKDLKQSGSQTSSMRAYFSICGLVMTRAFLAIAVILVVVLLVAATILKTAFFECDKSQMHGGSAGGGTK